MPIVLGPLWLGFHLDWKGCADWLHKECHERTLVRRCRVQVMLRYSFANDWQDTLEAHHDDTTSSMPICICNSLLGGSRAAASHGPSER